MSPPRDTNKTHRIVTLGRVVALLAIAAVAAFLAYTATSDPYDHAVSVPEGARAGQLGLHECTYPTEKGDVAADCGTLTVPENRADPKSRLIAVPVTRIRAKTKHPSEPLFHLEGGPGGTNMEFPMASRFTGKRDVVLVGYRGVDGSARLDCPEVSSARRHNGDLLSTDSVRESANGLRSCADRLRSEGLDLAGYTLPSRVDDMEAARRALGYKQIDLLSQSFGTRVALVYQWRHPRSIHRSVMLGANPPGRFLWESRLTTDQLKRFAALCGRGPECGTGSGDLPASMRRTAADLPKRWGPLPIHRGNVEIASFFGLMEASHAAAPVTAPMTLDTWRAAANGDASGLWFGSFAAQLLFPSMQVWGDQAAMGRIDAAFADRYFRRHRDGGRGLDLADSGTRFLWAAGALARACPAGPEEQKYARMKESDIPTLVVNGELDGTTPPQNSTRELMPHLTNGRQVTLRGFAHNIDFWNNQEQAGNRLINHYLDTGRVDASRYVPQKVDFTPPTTQPFLAKVVVGSMVGLGLFALLSVAGMALRVRSRGRLGRVTRVLARSAWAVLIGFGGWAATTLVALIVLPDVPFDAPGLMIPSVAVPVALAGYLAWRGPDRAASRKAAFVAVTAGALIGAGLGFLAASAMLAVATTLLGAVAGANLALIVADVSAETRRRHATEAQPADVPREPVLDHA
jgi:pimeloyl-ACP methyl ester carboxylesterase